MVNMFPNLTKKIAARVPGSSPDTGSHDLRTDPGENAAPRTLAERAQRHNALRIWLLLASLVVLLTLSVGGMTRLTNSGLSITEWEPVMGIIPPTTTAEWQEQFDKYKTTYEYRFVNMNMTLDEFRFIYNWEWRHRILARLIFLAVFLPFIVFLLAGRITKAMQTKVFVVLGLIVFQGFVGWFMVQSGLRNDVRVSSYRLALHLGLASLLFAMLIAMAFGQDRRPLPAVRDLARSRVTGRILIGLLFGLILLGALVAGLRGGRTHDTWPLMEGQLIPSNMFAMSPWIANFFENPLTVQWVHRLLAYAFVIGTIAHWRGTLRRDEPEDVQDSARWLMFGAGAQMLLGIITVLNQVPIPLGLAHQLLAFLLLALAIWHLFEIERHVAPVVEASSEATSWSETQTVTVPPVESRTSTVPPAAQPSIGTPAIPARAVVTSTRPTITLPTPPAPPVSGLGPVSSTPAVGGPSRTNPFPSIGASPIAGDRPSGPVSPTPYRRPLDS